jgi:hypothetical protein
VAMPVRGKVSGLPPMKVPPRIMKVQSKPAIVGEVQSKPALVGDVVPKATAKKSPAKIAGIAHPPTEPPPAALLTTRQKVPRPLPASPPAPPAPPPVPPGWSQQDHFGQGWSETS